MKYEWKKNKVLSMKIKWNSLERFNKGKSIKKKLL